MAHPQIQLPFAHEPVGQAEVVGVEMGDDEAAGQTQAQRFAPGCLHLRRGKAGVDERDLVLGIVDQPQVDVIERERQRHAQPVHAGSDGGHLSSSGVAGCG